MLYTRPMLVCNSCSGEAYLNLREHKPLMLIPDPTRGRLLIPQELPLPDTTPTGYCDGCGVSSDVVPDMVSYFWVEYYSTLDEVDKAYEEHNTLHKIYQIISAEAYMDSVQQLEGIRNSLNWDSFTDELLIGEQPWEEFMAENYETGMDYLDIDDIE